MANLAPPHAVQSPTPMHLPSAEAHMKLMPDCRAMLELIMSQCAQGAYLPRSQVMILHKTLRSLLAYGLRRDPPELNHSPHTKPPSQTAEGQPEPSITTQPAAPAAQPAAPAAANAAAPATGGMTATTGMTLTTTGVAAAPASAAAPAGAAGVAGAGAGGYVFVPAAMFEQASPAVSSSVGLAGRAGTSAVWKAPPGAIVAWRAPHLDAEAAGGRATDSKWAHSWRPASDDTPGRGLGDRLLEGYAAQRVRVNRLTQACNEQVDCIVGDCPRIHGQFDPVQEEYFQKLRQHGDHRYIGHVACRHHIRGKPCHPACTYRHFVSTSLRPLSKEQLEVFQMNPKRLSPSPPRATPNHAEKPALPTPATAHA